MARVHFWSFLLNEEGQPVEDGEVSIYLANTTTTAEVYTAEIGGSSISAAPQLVTNGAGFFEFWVPDSTEIGGYPISQKFKLVWEKSGISTGTIDNIDVFFKSGEEVDETDNVSSTKNKLISNLLAYTWEQHRLQELDENNEPHGISYANIFKDITINDVDSAVSPKTLDSFAGNEYDGAVWHYTCIQTSSGTVRTGTIQAAWNVGTLTLEQAKVETNNVGPNGTNISIDASFSATDVVLKATVSDDGWLVKVKRLGI